MLNHAKPWLGVVLIASLLMAGGCAFMSDLASPKKPEVSVVGQRLVAVNFNQVALEIDLAVNNPNHFSVPMGALDYQVKVQGYSLLQGQQPQGVYLQRQTETLVTLPLTIEFSEVASLLGGVLTSNQLNYQVLGGLSFDIPLLGKQRIPVQVAGDFPVPQLPRVQLAGLRADDLSFSSARLILDLELSNPNIFSLQLAEFDYGLYLKNQKVVGGALTPGLELAAEKSMRVAIPFSIRLRDLGTQAFASLTQGSPLDYAFSFSTAWGSSFSALKPFEYAAEREGKLSL